MRRKELHVSISERKDVSRSFRIKENHQQLPDVKDGMRTMIQGG